MSDNIKVVVKVRPLISREVEEKCAYRWRVKNNTLIQLDSNGRESDNYFTFDKVYDKETQTREVYDDVAKPIVEAALAGFNGTIFAYGQTSSGKTYTMTGTEESPGIIPLAVLNIFNIIKTVPNRDFLVRVSYIEIYNETVRDLLKIDKKNIKIHETYHGGVKVDVTERVTASPEDILEAMKEGEANRQTAATNMNEESSRSHSIFQITIESREHIEGEAEGGCVNVSQLNLVDLAGSERAGQTGATGLRFKEGTHINRSLSCLALVIKQLSEDPNKYVNFRDSKLTRILQNSLGGNAKTSIVCAVTPASTDETNSTLQFANRAKAIKNKPEVNAVATDATMIQRLTKQLSNLQAELATKRNLLETKQTVEESLQKQIAGLQKLILNGFGQRSSITGPRRKLQPPRRVTISTLHNIEEEPVPTAPKFCTPSLKYNPLALSAEFTPLQNTKQLPIVPEESRMTTPPPNPKNAVVDGEVIELDSDDDVSELQTCSPYHTCYTATKTPPCVLRMNAKEAEKHLKDIEEFTKWEKMYSPTVAELLEKQEHNAKVIDKLQEEINALSEKSNEKDSTIEELKSKIKETEEQVKNISSVKSDLETKCKDYETRLTDWEVSYETLKKNSKAREQDLLSLLEEQRTKKTEDIGKLAKNIDKPVLNFMDISKDISLVNSDNESSIHTNQDDASGQVQELLKDIQSQLANKNQTIIELEASISSQKQNICSLETSNQLLQVAIDDFKNKLLNMETENSFLKSTIDSLNSTIDNQKLHLESANKDIKSYNDTIQELQIKLNKKDSILNETKINETVLENMIANEEHFIANNDNIKNIIHCLKIALANRDKEIDTLKLVTQEKIKLVDENTALKEEIEKNENQITVLLEEAERLRDELKTNISVMSRLVQVEQDLTSQLNTLQEQNEILYNQNTEYNNIFEDLNRINADSVSQIEHLQEQNKQLTLIVHEKEINEQTISNKNQDLLIQIEDMSQKIDDLERCVNEKEDQISCVSEADKEIQEHVVKAQAILLKLHNALQRLNSNSENIPEINLNLETVLNVLRDKVENLEAVIIAVVEEKDQKIQAVHMLKEKLSSISDMHKSELEILQSQVTKMNNDLSIQTKELLRQVTELTENLNKTRAELDAKNKFTIEVEIKLHDAQENNKKLLNDLLSKENQFSSLQEQLATALADIKTSNQNKGDEIRTLNNKLQEIKTNSDKLIMEKDVQINLLQNELSGVTITIEEKHKEVAAALKDTISNRDKLLIGILNKASKLTEDYEVENRFQCESADSVYEQVILTLDKIANHIIRLQRDSNTEKGALEELLTIANNEIVNLTNKNVQLMTDFEELTNKNTKLLHEIERINKLNKELMGARELLSQLNMEVKMKSEEIKTMEDRAIEMKNQFKNHEISMKQQIEDNNMVLENAKLKDLQCKESLMFIDQSDQEFSPGKSRQSLVGNFDMRSPQSLITICFHKLLDSLQSNNSDLTSIITSSSTSVQIPNVETQTEDCKCHYLTIELKKAKEENLTLLKCIEELDTVNKFLLQEREEVRKEVQLLVEPANELQKKIINHRTNLSTLTATTYAENKLLNSQLKVLQHQHTRSINVCDRDLPAFKTQLNELMTILKEPSYLLDKQNASFKRYSLPDALDSNTSVSTFKNESTLDGDLLMMDTNISLITLAESTLVGHEQTCLEERHIHFGNETCQTNDFSKVIDPCLTTQIGTLTSDNLKLFERGKEENCKLSNPSLITDTETLSYDNLELFGQLEPVKEENNKSKQGIQNLTAKQSPIHIYPTAKTQSNSYRDAQSSSINMNVVAQILNKAECKMCDELQTGNEMLSNQISALVQTLEETKAQKDEFKQKFNNLTLEVPSIDALRRKLTNVEKDNQSKMQEIGKINNELNKKNKILKELQEENDTLSTQVMDNISEADDLKNDLNKLKVANSKLEEKCKQLEILAEEFDVKANSVVQCPECVLKDELINSLQSKRIERKLNRSFSDSDSSSRLNKICTLQSELHASKEDCKKITEGVATIKNHLELSHISMDLDVSMGEPNIFTFTKDFGSDAVNKFKTNVPEQLTDAYTREKIECLNFYIEKTGSGKENLNRDVKIIDVMKSLYNNLIANHGNEVENLLNQLKGFEESKDQVQAQLSATNSEYLKVSKQLEESNNNIKTVTSLISKIKNNTNIIQQELSNVVEAEKHSKLVNLFKDDLLKEIDTDLGLSLATVFDVLIDNVVKKHQQELSGIMDQYTKLEKHMENVVSEFNEVNENLKQIKCQLSDKENDYNLLKSQKERVFEISNAVTLDIVKKEKELFEALTIGCKKLEELNILVPCDINSALSVNENIMLLFERLMQSGVDATNEKQQLIIELSNLRTSLGEKEKTIGNLNNKLMETENKLENQKSLHEDLIKIYENKVKENKDNVEIIKKINEEIFAFNDSVVEKNKCIPTSEHQRVNKTTAADTVSNLEGLKYEYNSLKSVNEMIIKEKEMYAAELEKAQQIIKKNKTDLEKMTSDILVLRESVNDNVSVIESLTLEAKSLMEQNVQLKTQFEERNKNCLRLEMNIKTHEKTAEIQSKMIMRLQKQKEENDILVTETNKQLEELTEKYSTAQTECDTLKENLKSAKDEIHALTIKRNALEAQICSHEDREDRRPSIDVDNTRRRRQSLYDSQRAFQDNMGCDEHNKIEAIFDSRPKPEDLFANVDEDSSNRSTPVRLSRGRDSFTIRQDQSDKEEEQSRPSSVSESRRRRQSVHDKHRASLARDSAHDCPTKLDQKPDILGGNSTESDVGQLRERVTRLQRELEELTERNKELDDECETCAQYLQERDEQCRKLKKEKIALERQVAELIEKLNSPPNRSNIDNKPSTAHASVNTDADWANLHSVVVDRMSFDVEVEKNKKLSRTIEELRCNKQELKNTIAKMHKVLEKNAGYRESKELEATKSELAACKQQLEELQTRYRELDEECDTCAQYLRERDKQCRQLRDDKRALEVKLAELQEECGVAVEGGAAAGRRKRQSLHDKNRSPTGRSFDKHTDVTDDFLNNQVERDSSAAGKNAQELKKIKITLERVVSEKAALEARLSVAEPTLFVATGSAIVQNQQITDVMKENQKLKKINQKLINICKKRGKCYDSNIENEEPSELG